MSILKKFFSFFNNETSEDFDMAKINKLLSAKHFAAASTKSPTST